MRVVVAVVLSLAVGGCSSSTTGTGGPSSSTSGSSGSSGASGSSGSSGSSGGGGDCNTPLVAAAISGGCAPRLVTPAPCEVVDLSGGKTYEIAWTTDGTGCETPWTFDLTGSPPSGTNAYSAKVNENGTTITRNGGIVDITAATSSRPA